MLPAINQPAAIAIRLGTPTMPAASQTGAVAHQGGLPLTSAASSSCFTDVLAFSLSTAAAFFSYRCDSGACRLVLDKGSSQRIDDRARTPFCEHSALGNSPRAG